MNSNWKMSTFWVQIYFNCFIVIFTSRDNRLQSHLKRILEYLIVKNSENTLLFWRRLSIDLKVAIKQLKYISTHYVDIFHLYDGQMSYKSSEYLKILNVEGDYLIMLETLYKLFEFFSFMFRWYRFIINLCLFLLN